MSNWKIIEKSCNCELERFLTFKDAVKYMYAKNLDFKIFEIKPVNVIDLKARNHNILILSDLGKIEQYKDVLTVSDFYNRIKKPDKIKKRRYLVFKIDKTYITIKDKNSSDHHKTNLKDLVI